MRAYYMDSSSEDQRKPHERSPPQEVSLSQLAEFGVLYWHLGADM